MTGLGLIHRPNNTARGANMANSISISDIRALISYNPITGDLSWRDRVGGGVGASPGVEYARKWNFRHSGKPALSIIDDKGYKHGRVLSVNIKAHRAAWAIYYGYWPEVFVDHINGDRSDNRIENLREATRSQNARNRVSTKNSTSRYLGVHWNSRDKIWESQISDGVNVMRIGKHNCEIMAAKAYDAAALEIHGEFAKPNFGK